MNHIKLTLIGLVIMPALNAQSLSRFSFGLNSSYLINTRVFTYHKSDLYVDYRNSNEKYIPGFDLSATIDYKIIDNVSIGTGFGYSTNGYRTKEEYLIDPGYSPITAEFTSELYRFSYKNVVVPLHFNYSTNKKLNYSICVGPSFVFPISENVEWILRKEYGSPNNALTTIIPNNSKFKKLNISFDVGFGLGYKLTDNLNLIIQPKVSYYVLGNENTWIRDHLYNIGRFVGENKSTREHLVSFGLTLKIIISP